MFGYLKTSLFNQKLLFHNHLLVISGIATVFYSICAMYLRWNSIYQCCVCCFATNGNQRKKSIMTDQGPLLIMLILSLATYHGAPRYGSFRTWVEGLLAHGCHALAEASNLMGYGAWVTSNTTVCHKHVWNNCTDYNFKRT